jgi:PIN domain nuclease of toxin-antitoxin system
MRLLLDTHLLLWALAAPERLSEAAVSAINEEGNKLFFSAASLWEVAIKASHGRRDFVVDVIDLHTQLLVNGYIEVPVLSVHSFAVVHLPHLHKDPFDRLLLAQAMREDLTLLTADELLASYPGPILKV